MHRGRWLSLNSCTATPHLPTKAEEAPPSDLRFASVRAIHAGMVPRVALKGMVGFGDAVRPEIARTWFAVSSNDHRTEPRPMQSYWNFLSD